MHCNHCKSIMDEVRKQESELSVQVWHKCTMCGRISMSSVLTHHHAENANSSPDWAAYPLAAQLEA